MLGISSIGWFVAVFRLSSSSGRFVWGVLLACLAAYGAGSVRTGFDGQDEYRYAHIAKEMNSPERFFILHNQGQLYLDKPPLYFWMARGCYALLGGVSAFGARLPLIVCTLLTVLLVWDLGRRLFGDRAGLLAAVAFGLAFRPIWSAHNTKLDPPLVLFVTLALWFWVLGRQGGGPGRRPAWWSVLGFWVAMGLGFLTKGPLGLLPVFVLLLYHLERRRWRGVVGWSTLGGMLAFLGVLAVWLVPALVLGAWDGYLSGMAGQELVGRVVHPPQHMKSGVVDWVYFFAYVWGDFFPSAFFVPGALYLAWKRWGEDGERDRALLFSACWFLGLIIFFTFMRSKRSQYILPSYPGGALLVGSFLDRVLSGLGGLRAAWHRVPMWIVGVAGWGAAVFVWAGSGFIAGRFGVPVPVYAKVTGSLVMAGLGSLSLYGAWRGRLRIGLVGYFGMIPAGLAVAYFMYFPLVAIDKPFQVFSRRMEALLGGDEIVFVWKRRQPQLSIWGNYVTYGLKEPGALRLLGFDPWHDDPSYADLLRAFGASDRPLLLVLSGRKLESVQDGRTSATLHPVWSGMLPIYSQEGGFHVVSNVADYVTNSANNHLAFM